MAKNCEMRTAKRSFILKYIIAFKKQTKEAIANGNSLQVNFTPASYILNTPYNEPQTRTGAT